MSPRSLEVFNLRGPSLVKPLHLDAAKDSHAYFLSNLDLALAHPVLAVRVLFVFDANHTRPAPTAHMLQESLKKVLVHYSPLAGRLAASPQGRLCVDCNGDGVYFVEADANIEISELGDLALPDRTVLRHLLYPIPDVEDAPLLSAMVTRFKCGGFVLGLAFQHCMLDAASLGDFLNAWGDITRGLPVLSIPPFLDRSILRARTPLQVEHPHTEFVPIKDIDISGSGGPRSFEDALVIKSFCFTPRSVEKLKKEAMEGATSSVSKCRTFDAIAAVLWKAHTQALPIGAEQKVKLVVVGNGREAGLPKGYMGNGLIFTCAVARAGELEEQPLSYAVKQVQRAKERAASDGYLQSQIDYMERERMLALPLAGSLVVNAWYTFDFHDADFGSGKPKRVLPPSGLRDTAFLLRLDHRTINAVVGLPRHAAQKMEELLLPHCTRPQSSSTTSKL